MKTAQARPPARPGDAAATIETPALIVDLDALERNIKRMADGARSRGLALRPHAKSHKCAEIVAKQLAAGAVGICCQKVDEALAMVEAGVPDVYISNQVVVPAKLRRLARAARDARIALAFDSAEGVEAAALAARTEGCTIDALVELDLGDGRAGVPPGQPAVDLARRILTTPGLRFIGLQAYKATAQHAPTAPERRRLGQDASAAVHMTRAALTAAGIACRTVSGSGTGAWSYEAETGAYTELQPGSYVFMDAAYNRITGEDGGAFHEFENALFLLATVTSAVAPGRAMCDAGCKALEFGSAGPPDIADWPRVEYRQADDEHGRLRWPPDGPGPRVGQRVTLIPANCDPTVNLHDWLVGVRSGRVESLWRINARGPGL